MRKSELPRKRSVFLDPRGRRARYTNAALITAGSLLFAGLTLIAVGVIWGPGLLRPQFADAHALDGTKAETRSASSQYEPSMGQIGIREPTASNTQTLRFAYYSSDNLNSFLSLMDNADALDGLLPDWYALSTNREALSVTRSPESARSLPWIRANAPHIVVFPRLTISAELPNIQEALIDTRKRNALARNVAHAVDNDGFAGVTIEFSSASGGLLLPLLDFLRDLGTRLRAENHKLIVSVDPDWDPYMVGQLAPFADYVLIQTEDEFPLRANTGAIASQGWFERTIRRNLLAVPSSKLIVSIGTFGYDFDAFGGETQISVQRAWDLSSQAGTTLRFDKQSMNSTFVYRATNGHWHQVWFSDAVTVYNQLRTALSVSPAAVAVWRLGSEDPGLWRFAGRGTFPDAQALASLAEVPPGYGGHPSDVGTLVQIGRGHNGTREVHFNATLGLIDNEVMTTFPRFADAVPLPPASANLVALTFDDGPDDRYTPKVLDVLAKHNVKATFYLIGENAFSSLDILKRIYREGHDIGSHSFTHPELRNCSRVRVAAELNATQRLIQSQLGVTTLLFRMPYQDAGMDFIGSSRNLIETVHGLGYLWGVYNVESNDFRRLPYQAEWIVRDVLREVHEREQAHGGKSATVLLMHDSGGNREATIKALPQVIESLRAEGYRFVTTHELVGLSRDAVMPRSDPSDFLLETVSALRLGSIRTLSWVAGAIPTVAIVTAILGTLRLTLVVLIAAHQHWHRSRNCGDGRQVDVPGHLAVVVPAHNEESVICKTVRALLDARCRKPFDILVVDDGSTDATAEVVRTAFASEPRVKVFTKENGGKSSALNFGYRNTDADIIVAIDGDTVLEPDAIEHLTQPFKDPRIGAVAGNVIVGNQLNLMTRFQALEYVTSQNLDRIAFEPFNAICVVPGAIGAWRRKAVLEVGGYSDDNLAEDADLTVRLALSGWRIVSRPEARALTEAPEALHAFLKQRFRWMFGMLQVAYKHKSAPFLQPTGVSLICIPNILIFQFGFTLLAPFMDAILFWTLLIALGSVFGITNAPIENLTFIAAYWVVFQTIDVSAAAAGIYFNGERRYWRLLPLVLLQRFTYRQLLYWTASKVLLAALRGVLVGWGRLARSGNVQLPSSRSVRV